MTTKKRAKRPRRLLLRGQIARRQRDRKTNPKKNFTKRWIASLPHPPEGQRDTYLDETTPHLRLRVTPTAKTFYWEKTIGGRLAVKLKMEPGTKRVTIGRFPEFNVEQARDRAAEIAGEYASGIDLQQQVRERAKKQAEIALDDRTFGDLWADYRENRPRRTQEQRRNGEYSRNLEQQWKLVFADEGKEYGEWDTKKLSEITEDMVAALIDKLREKGPIYANRIHAHGKAMFNFAIRNRRWRWKGENPFKYDGLESEKGRERSRKKNARVHDIPKFIESLGVCSEDMRLLLLCTLLTGRRITEVKAMRWGDLDLEAGLWFPKTKTEPQKTWLPTEIVESLTARQKHADEGEEWVFPSSSKSGHIEEIKKAWDEVRKATGLPELQARDLRRSFISWAQEQGVPIAAVQSQVGHANISTTAKHYTAFSDTAQSNWVNKTAGSMTKAAK